MSIAAFSCTWLLYHCACLLFLCDTLLCVDKWAWEGRGRNNGFYPDESLENRPIPSNRPPAPIYETSDYHPPPYQPNRPPYRPSPEGPVGPVRPVVPVGEGNGAPGILTGPVPSWLQGKDNPYRYRHYDRCKCAYSFNCNSPSISFGSCDAGKQYCCYNTKVASQGHGSFIEEEHFRETDRPYSGNPDVLIGPGGPTGIIIDPTRSYGRPTRPYFPYQDYRHDEDNVYGTYGRSNADKRKHEKKN